MISETLKFITEEVNQYLVLQLGVNTDPYLVQGNVARAFDPDTSGGGGLSNKAILTLVNVEEDRVSRDPNPFHRTETGIQYRRPALHFNLYLLFSFNRTNYVDNPLWLSHVIRFFQHQPVFESPAYPRLHPRIEKLVVELHTLNFEQINHLWSTLGGKYLPSVLYKVRQVTVDEEQMETQGPPILEIEGETRHKNLP